MKPIKFPTISLRGMTKVQALDRVIEATVDAAREVMERNFIEQRSPEWVRRFGRTCFEEQLPDFRAQVEVQARAAFARELATLH